MSPIFDLIRRGVVGQAIIASLLIGGTLLLLLTDREVPNFLITLDSVVVTFYFTIQIQRSAQNGK